MKKAILYLLIILLSGCSVEKSEELLLKELLEADQAFSALSLEKGMNHAFITYCAQEAVLLRNDAMPLRGKEAIGTLLGLRSDSGYNLSWEPLHATIAKSGDLGYTFGTFVMEMKESGEHSRGSYVSIWVKEDDMWKWILDTGNEGLGE